jgi:RimJ/RimL family protein N-acetyltransferase
MRQDLASPRLFLENLRPEQAAEMFQVLQDPGMYTYIPLGPPETPEVLRERYARQASHPDEEGIWLNWILRLKAGSACIGYVQATIPPGEPALLAYQLSPHYWCQGYASEACRAVIGHLAQAYRLGQIEAVVDSRNLASVRLLGALGFRRRDFRPRAEFFKGEWSDELVFSLALAGGETAADQET